MKSSLVLVCKKKRTHWRKDKDTNRINLLNSNKSNQCNVQENKKDIKNGPIGVTIGKQKKITKLYMQIQKQIQIVYDIYV